jgi:3-hydroxy acid dehydrogenase/malonic semialdehyde reductase
MKIALITGATSGIGKATAQRFANEGINLILCGRRLDRLELLKKELSKQVDVHIANFDVADKNEVNNAITNLPLFFKKIDILINNAGNAHGLSDIQDGNLDDWDAMIDINVKGLLYISKAIISGMIAQKGGHIINIGSTAAKQTYRKGAVYCASKSAVEALTEGMRIDLIEHGIKVGAIHPGLTASEFSKVRFKGDLTKANKVYQGYEALKPEDIADVIHFTISRPYHINISDLTITPAAQANSTTIHKK